MTVIENLMKYYKWSEKIAGNVYHYLTTLNRSYGITWDINVLSEDNESVLILMFNKKVNDESRLQIMNKLWGMLPKNNKRPYIFDYDDEAFYRKEITRFKYAPYIIF